MQLRPDFLYYATFAPGMGETASAILRARLPEADIQKLLDGGILFETSCEYSRLNFFCFNNIFAVIGVMEHSRAEGALEAHIKRAVRGGVRDWVIAENNRKIRSFRIVTSRENRLVPVEAALRGKAEAFIAALSRLRVNRERPDTEFWFLYRSEGCSLFMKRLTKHPSFEKSLHRGELPPSLAYMMCWLSRPKQGDVVTDPFCGYGSIPEQRLKHFPQADFYAFDISAEAVASTRAKTGPGCHVRRVELRRIPELLPETGVDAVITDPPWGLYAETALPPEDFHREMIAVFGEILKPGGIIIILTARKEELSRAAAASDCLVITGTIPVLVSGRKAAIFTLVKDGAYQTGDTAIHR